jgi:hypothetical protein
MCAKTYTFEAKGIQSIVGISKSRYEYLAIKIGISPDVQEVEGTGRSHVYSIKNLMQFAFAHFALCYGLSRKQIKKILPNLPYERAGLEGCTMNFGMEFGHLVIRLDKIVMFILKRIEG